MERDQEGGESLNCWLNLPLMFSCAPWDQMERAPHLSEFVWPSLIYFYANLNLHSKTTQDSSKKHNQTIIYFNMKKYFYRWPKVDAFNNYADRWDGADADFWEVKRETQSPLPHFPTSWLTNGLHCRQSSDL